jgi:SAM-dependent MidA family methyltransferase
VGFEPTIPASERAKTVHALDRSAILKFRKYLLCWSLTMHCDGWYCSNGTGKWLAQQEKFQYRGMVVNVLKTGDYLTGPELSALQGKIIELIMT